jgi:aspartate/methionine/tyrosine aminotransferase
MDFRPKAIIVNTPYNPTGGLLQKADLKLLKDIADDYDLFVLSDEIDWAFVYDDQTFSSPASIDDLCDRTIVIDGFSKVFGMTGWRIGFAAGSKSIIEKMHLIQEHSISAPSTFAQYGCLQVVDRYENYVKEVLEQCAANRSIVVDAFKGSDNIIMDSPQGGFYVYPRLIDNRFVDAKSFASALLDGAGVSVIPGDFFGDKRKRFRLC